MSAPESGRPWLTGDVLVRRVEPGWTVPPGWTTNGDHMWRVADQCGPGEPDTYVVTPPEYQQTDGATPTR